MKVAQKWWMNRIFRFQLILKGLNGSHQEVIESCFLLKNSTHSRIRFLPKFLKLPNNCQRLRKLHFPTRKNRWEKPGATCWTLLGFPNLSCQHEPPGKAQLLYIPGGDHGISQSTAFFNFCSFLTQSYVVIWWGHWAVSISSISQAENVPNENPLILRPTDYGASAVYLHVPTFTPPKLPNLIIWSFTATWRNMFGNIFHWYLKPIIFQPRTYKHTTQTRCVCQIVTYHNLRIRKKLWISKQIRGSPT